MKRKRVIAALITVIILIGVVIAVNAGAKNPSSLQDIFTAASEAGVVAKLKVVGHYDDGAAKAKVAVGNTELPVEIYLRPWSPVHHKIPLQWISPSKLLVDGQAVYDSTTNGLTTLDTKLDYVSDYELNPAKTSLALVGKKDGNIETVIVDLSTWESTRVFSRGPLSITGELNFQVAWDRDGNLYFDNAENQTPVIMVYKEGKVSVFKNAALFPVASPDGTVLTYRLADSFYEKTNSRPTRTAILRLDAEGSEKIIDINGKVDFGGTNDRLALIKSEGYAVYAVKPKLELLHEDRTPMARAFFNLRDGKVTFKTEEWSTDGARITGIVNHEVNIN